MELSNYGIILRRLTEDKIEQVRNWRNEPKIQETMLFQDYITPEMQKEWFNRIKDKDLYYIIEFENEEIGVINIKDIDTEKLIGESGVFIVVDKYLNTDIAYRAHLVLFDYIYEKLHFTSTYSHIRKDNPRASRFSLFLGGVNETVELDTDIHKFTLTKDNYLQNKNRLRFIKKWNILNQ